MNNWHLKHLIATILFIITLMMGGCSFEKLYNDDDKESKQIDYYKKPLDEENLTITPTSYDYSNLAKSITSSCETDYQKIKAIYQWICDNIEYDTDYKIYHADECYEAKKGVCQAYCELFYYIAKAVNIKTEIITGKTKDFNGEIPTNGHAWLFAYTRKNHGILLDPTWGAGTVDKGVFHRNRNIWEWFNVEPEFMVLSHLPKNESYQLLDDPVSSPEFLDLQSSNYYWTVYNIKMKDIFPKIRNHTLDLPKFYSPTGGSFELIDYPMTSTLEIGEWYKFRIKLKSYSEFSIINGNIFCKNEEWDDEGDGIYSIKFMPRQTEPLYIATRRFDRTDNSYYYNIKYDIANPDKNNWKNVEEYYPLDIPEVKHVNNLNKQNWEEVGVTPEMLLDKIRTYQVKTLPYIFRDKGQLSKIASIPMDYDLKIGTRYRFSFYPKAGIKWAIINGNRWYHDWEVADDNLHTMIVTPTENGRLSLSVQFEDYGDYWEHIRYNCY